MKLIKAYLWLLLCWGVKTVGLRKQAWFNEHVSRVRELKRQLAMGPFVADVYIGAK